MPNELMVGDCDYTTNSVEGGSLPFSAGCLCLVSFVVLLHYDHAHCYTPTHLIQGAANATTVSCECGVPYCHESTEEHMVSLVTGSHMTRLVLAYNVLQYNCTTDEQHSSTVFAVLQYILPDCE